MNKAPIDIFNNPDYHRNIHILLKGVLNLPISGGSGKSMNDPFIIELTEKNDIVGIEYEILKWIGILNGYNWEVIEQSLNFPNGKKIDQLKVEIIHCKSDQTIIMDYFFDITICFDKYKSDVSIYLKHKH